MSERERQLEAAIWQAVEEIEAGQVWQGKETLRQVVDMPEAEHAAELGWFDDGDSAA